MVAGPQFDTVGKANRAYSVTHFYEHISDSLARLGHGEAVARFAAGASLPGEAIAGLSAEQLNAVPIPDTWSIRQIIVHLMDTDLIAAYRMKRIIAEDSPELDLYDEVAFSKNLFYERMNAHRACAIFKMNRLQVADLLIALPDSAFERVGIHQEMGPMSLGLLLRLYIKHLDHHMAFVVKKMALISS